MVLGSYILRDLQAAKEQSPLYQLAPLAALKCFFSPILVLIENTIRACTGGPSSLFKPNLKPPKTSLFFNLTAN